MGVWVAAVRVGRVTEDRALGDTAIGAIRRLLTPLCQCRVRQSLLET